MANREARIGAGSAGALLLAIAIADWALGTDNPDVVNLITGILGAALLTWAILARGRHLPRANRR